MLFNTTVYKYLIFLKQNENSMESVYQPIRRTLSAKSNVDLHHLLAAREGRSLNSFICGIIAGSFRVSLVLEWRGPRSFGGMFWLFYDN